VDPVRRRLLRDRAVRGPSEPESPGTSGCTNLIIGSGGTRNVPGDVIADSRLVRAARRSGSTDVFLYWTFIVDSRLTGVSLQTGTGSATFYFANSSASITFNSLPIIQLSAPTSGPLNGILIYQSTSDTNTLPIEGAPVPLCKESFMRPTPQWISPMRAV